MQQTLYLVDLFIGIRILLKVSSNSFLIHSARKQNLLTIFFTWPKLNNKRLSNTTRDSCNVMQFFRTEQDSITFTYLMCHGASFVIVRNKRPSCHVLGIRQQNTESQHDQLRQQYLNHSAALETQIATIAQELTTEKGSKNNELFQRTQHLKSELNQIRADYDKKVAHHINLSICLHVSVSRMHFGAIYQNDVRYAIM